MLVVDDDNFALLGLKSILESIGISPYLCRGGEEAVRVFQDKYKATCCFNKFTFVFTDIQMPIMDGFKVAQCIRATEMAWSGNTAGPSPQGK